jgi:hypothetical protein
MSLFNDYLNSLPKDAASAIVLKIVELQNIMEQPNLSIINQEREVAKVLLALPLELVQQLAHALSLMVEARKLNEQD